MIYSATFHHFLLISTELRNAINLTKIMKTHAKLLFRDSFFDSKLKLGRKLMYSMYVLVLKCNRDISEPTYPLRSASTLKTLQRQSLEVKVCLGRLLKHETLRRFTLKNPFLKNEVLRQFSLKRLLRLPKVP